MAAEKLPEAESMSAPNSISEDAGDWIQQFTKHLSLNFLDTSRSFPPDAGLPDFQDATARAAWQTLLDSGMTSDSILDSIGPVLVERRAGRGEWNSELNRRRFDLIDKDIQQSLTLAERIELAGLTRLMRDHVESEANLPLEGARELHRQLLDLDARKKPR
jgi:hypothetical protein